MYTTTKPELKKILTKWAKYYNNGSQKDNQTWYDVQVMCNYLHINFQDVLDYMTGKKSKFNPAKLS